MLRCTGKVTRVNEPRPYTLDNGTSGVSRKVVVLVNESDIHTITLREGQPDFSTGQMVDLAVVPMVSGGRLKLRNEGDWSALFGQESRKAS